MLDHFSSLDECKNTGKNSAHQWKNTTSSEIHMHPQCTSGDISGSKLARRVHGLQQWKGLVHKDSITSNSTLNKKHVLCFFTNLKTISFRKLHYNVLKKKKKPLIFKSIHTCPREDRTRQERPLRCILGPFPRCSLVPCLPPPPTGHTELQLQHWGAAAVPSGPTPPPAGKGPRMAALRRLLQVYFLLLLYL